MATDEVQVILNQLYASWNKSNTDGALPIFKKAFEVKKTQFRATMDWVIAYSTSDVITPQGLGTSERENILISVDIRTAKSRDHSLKLRDEVLRIIRENKNYTGIKFNNLFVRNIQDLTNKLTGMYRFVIDIDCYDYVV